MVIRIIGTGSSLPQQVVTNDGLAEAVDTSDEWIFSRTGIRERHLVKEETTASMSVEAAERALINAGIGAEEVDLIIVATITGDYLTPSTACEVQAGLGARRAVAFDINAACSGFMLIWKQGFTGRPWCWERKLCPKLWIGKIEALVCCLATEQERRWCVLLTVRRG